MTGTSHHPNRLSSNLFCQSISLIRGKISDLYVNQEQESFVPIDLDEPWPDAIRESDRLLFHLTLVMGAVQLPSIRNWLTSYDVSHVTSEWTEKWAWRSRERIPEVLTDFDRSLLRSLMKELGDNREEYEFLRQLAARPLGQDLIRRFRHWWYTEHPADCAYSYRDEHPAFSVACLAEAEWYSLCYLHQFQVFTEELAAILRTIVDHDSTKDDPEFFDPLCRPQSSTSKNVKQSSATAGRIAGIWSGSYMMKWPPAISDGLSSTIERNSSRGKIDSLINHDEQYHPIT